MNVLDDACDVHAEMWEIRLRHEAGTQTISDARRYRACWQALALRRSSGRRTHLPSRFDDVLAERALLIRQIQVERARQAVEAVFQSTSGAESLPG